MDLIKKVKYISMTTDAWTSFAKQSYITVTAHLIDVVDDKLQLLHFVLDTSEIKVNHTSENLLKYVKKVIDKFNLEPNVNDIVINYDSTYNEDNLEEEIDFLRTVRYYDEDDSDYDNDDEQDDNDNVQASQDSQDSQLSVSQSQIDLDQTQMTPS